MDRGAWQAAVHGVTRVEHPLATKQQNPAVVVEQSTPKWPNTIQALRQVNGPQRLTSHQNQLLGRGQCFLTLGQAAFVLCDRKFRVTASCVPKLHLEEWRGKKQLL